MNINLIFQICLIAISCYMVFCIFLLLIGRMLDNGFNFSKAIKDEMFFRINKFKYPFWIKEFQKSLGKSIGFKTEQYEFRDTVVYSLTIFFNNQKHYFYYYPKEHNSWSEVNSTIEILFKETKPLLLSYKNRGEIEVYNLKNNLKEIKNNTINKVKDVKELISELKKEGRNTEFFLNNEEALKACIIMSKS